MGAIGFYAIYEGANWFIDQMMAGLYVGYQVMCQ